MKGAVPALSPGLGAAVEGFNARWEGTVVSVRWGEHPGGIHLAVDGVLDQVVSPAFQGLASMAMRESQASGALVLDLSRLRYISSMGVAVFPSLFIEGKKLGVVLYLDGMADNIRTLFEVLGFSSYFVFSEREAGR